jgi:hypothetical protein
MRPLRQCELRNATTALVCVSLPALRGGGYTRVVLELTRGAQHVPEVIVHLAPGTSGAALRVVSLERR